MVHSLFFFWPLRTSRPNRLIKQELFIIRLTVFFPSYFLIKKTQPIKIANFPSPICNLKQIFLKYVQLF